MKVVLSELTIKMAIPSVPLGDTALGAVRVALSRLRARGPALRTCAGLGLRQHHLLIGEVAILRVAP